MSSTIRAAGGVVWSGPRATPLVAVIHRPHRADWSLPKGKLHSAERPITAAVREVVEETGLQVSVQHQLGSVRYRVDGAPKVVSYWSMRHEAGAFIANDEADQLVWLDVRAALERLSFGTDREIVERFAARPVPDTAVLLVRHARAGKRSEWKKADEIRPLDAHGRRQALEIAEFGALFAPGSILSATPLRCRSTVEPLAKRVGLPLEQVPDFSDADYARHPGDSVRALHQVAQSRSVVVVSSQGETIPGMLDAIDTGGAPHESRKGSIWALFFLGGTLTQADYYRRPSLTTARRTLPVTAGRT